MLGKIGAGDEVPNADQLDPLDELSCHFSEPLVARTIHLVVQLPPGELPAAMIGVCSYVQPWFQGGVSCLLENVGETVLRRFMQGDYGFLMYSPPMLIPGSVEG
jgi:hypothetical protein